MSATGSLTERGLLQQYFPQSLIQYLQRQLRLYHPISHGLATQLDAVLFEQAFLAVKR